MKAGTLEEKVVLVTGGARGCGAAIVRAAHAEGARVVIHYGSSAEQAQALAGELGEPTCHLVGADLADPGAAMRLWHSALEWGGRVDVLINNAAIYPAIEFDDDDEAWDTTWANTLQVNLVAPARLSRAALAHFRERTDPGRDDGIIVNIESRAAFRGDGPMYSSYAASKAGLMAFGRTMARGFAGEGVLVFGISPGWIDTDMAAAGIAELGREYVNADIPLGEIVPPEEIANLAVFLASGKARHATGTSIDINGGSYPR